ncbi:MAG: hypothetical protein LLG43_05630 [Deltaproteobacteria bacterium]|nr:hypothetical protein [Deltaproteobacteria bacterium]
MKKLVSFVAVLALVCFTTMVFASGAPKADAVKPATTATAAAPAMAKAEPAKADVVIGKITKIDTTKGEILVKGKAILVKAGEIAKLKKGENVKVTLATGTNNAEKIEIIKAKKIVKKEVKAKEKPADKKAE